jgi:hypothetical protein
VRAASVDPAHGDPEAALVALSMDHAYQALEQILLAIERALRLPERSGSQWHRTLLADAGRDLPGVRPALLPPDSERDWEELLGFRHFIRHAYATDLDPVRLRKNVDRLARAVRATDPLITAALAVLEPREDG